MAIEFTRRGYIEVFHNGSKVSQHLQEREAIERVTNLILERPQNEFNEYEIRGYTVMAKGYGVLSPGTPGGDTTPPSAPGNLTGSATSATTLTLSWTAATDNVAVAGYQIFRNGIPRATTTSLSYNDSGLTPSTQYSYTVTAYDAAGNNSTAAGPALVTTNSNSAPVWSLGNQSYDNGDAVNISLDSVCSDADGDTITYSLVSGSLPTGLALSGSRNQTLSGTVTADGSYAFVLGASDGIAAVQNVSLTFTVTTPDTTAPDAPDAPTIVDATSSTITLSLPTSAASDHASYTIQRSTDGVGYGNRATGITAESWQDTGLNAGTTYYYRLIDVDTSGNASAAGPADSGQTDAAPSGTNASRINAILAGRAPHFSYNTPADPVITREVTVTSSAQFNSEAQTAGTRIIVNTSFSGSVSISANDIDVVMSNSATITGNLTLGGYNSRATRVRWTGGNISGRLLGVNFQDTLFDDFYLHSGPDFNDLTAGGQRFDRVAFINTTIRNTGNPSGNGWALFVLQRPTDPHRGIIFANFKVQSTGLHAFRLMSVNDIVIVDSVFNPDGTAASTALRIHLNSTDVWVKDSWVRGNVHMAGVDNAAGDAYPQVVNGLFDNVDRYVSLDLYTYSVTQPPFSSGEIRNSRMYSTNGAGSGTFGAPSGGWTLGTGNDRVAWDGVAVPDYSNVGAVR